MNPPRLGHELAAFADIFGLLMECPLHRGNPQGCELHGVRELPLHDRYAWAKHVGPQEVCRICAGCPDCTGWQRATWGSDALPPAAAT